MAFPTTLDTFPSAADLADDTLNTKPHSTLHGDIGTAVAALEAKVGVNSSAVTTTHDYKIAALESGKQPLDTDLTAFAALASTANKLPYATGSGAWALADFSSAGRALVDDADAAAQRFTLSTYSISEVDSLIASTAANVGKRARVRAATTANITIATALNNGDSLDGVTLATGDLVLVKDQSTAAQNGIYVVGASPARFAEFDTYDEHVGSLVSVAEGTANADTLWLGTSNAGGTLDTTAIAFAKMIIAGELLSTNNLSDLGNAATARTNLGLTIGVNVQAFHDDLLNLATVWDAASPSGPSQLAFYEDTDTGTSKITLVGVSSVTSDKTLTLPDATDTLVGRATTDTLANKTLTTPTIADLTNMTHAHQSAAGGGTLNAAAIAAGTLATARLGTGTADGTTVLFGDQSWGPLDYASGITTNNLSTYAGIYANKQRNMSEAEDLAALTSGTLFVTQMWLPAGAVISKIAFFAGATALSVGTHQWFGLYDGLTRAKLALTTNDTSTAWGANVRKALNIATDAAGASISSYTIPVSGGYYIVCCVVATQVPTLRGDVMGATTLLNLGPVVNGNSSTGQTTPALAPATAAAITVSANVPYCEVA